MVLSTSSVDAHSLTDSPRVPSDLAVRAKDLKTSMANGLKYSYPCSGYSLSPYPFHRVPNALSNMSVYFSFSLCLSCCLCMCGKTTSFTWLAWCIRFIRYIRFHCRLPCCFWFLFLHPSLLVLVLVFVFANVSAFNFQLACTKVCNMFFSTPLTKHTTFLSPIALMHA